MLSHNFFCLTLLNEKKFPEVRFHLFTSGVHPHEAKSWDEETEEALRELLTNHEVVAVGECGLDFNRNFSPQETQLEVFHKQVNH